MSNPPDDNPLAEPLLPEGATATTTSNNNNTRAEEGPTSTNMLSASFVLAATLGSLPMLLFGFNTGVVNAPESVIFPGHSVGAWSLVVSAFCVGGFFGSASAGRYADQYGRRMGLGVVLALNGLAGVLHVAAPNLATLVVARIGVGLAGGAATVLTPMYLSEIAPTEIKGSIGTLTQLSVVVGILISVLYALPFCTTTLWRWIFVPLPLTSAVGLAIGYFRLPESPKWLLLHRYETRAEEARNIIRQFRNLRSEEDEEAVEMEILIMTNNNTSSIRSSAAEEEEEGEEELHQSAAVSESTSFIQFAQDPRNRVPLISSILFPVAQQLSGINAVFFYSTLFFNGVISNPTTGTIIAFAVNVVATLVALGLMDRLGRKTLLALSAGGMALCCILLTLSLHGTLPPLMTVFCVLLYISFFEMGLGCIPFFLASELIQPQFLGTVQSISMASNWGSNFCVGLLFPYMDKFLGAYSFVPFGIILIGTLWYAIWVLPETRGKSLDMVLEELRANQPQRISQHDTDEAPLPPSGNTPLNEVV